jgi:hypothetical protein
VTRHSPGGAVYVTRHSPGGAVYVTRQSPGGAVDKMVTSKFADPYVTHVNSTLVCGDRFFR